MRTTKQFLLMLLLCFCAGSMHAQVKIGEEVLPTKGAVLDLKKTATSNYYLGGLLLPNVEILDLGFIPATFTEADKMTGYDASKGVDSNASLAGMIVYNTGSNTAKGVYMWDGENWQMVGSSGFTSDCPTTPVAADGSENISCSITDPTCPPNSGEYTFQYIQGEDFTTLNITDAGAGKFTLTFTENDQANDRTAILMVISPCGNSAIFAYTQKGDDSDCPDGQVPTIKSYNDNSATSLCSGNGAVYLYLDGLPTTGNYIWTLNGKAVGNGVTYTATQSGRYIVYNGKIGCPNSSSINISLSSNGYTGNAPEPVNLIWATNDGLQCAAGDAIRIKGNRALESGESIVWYCDGIRQVAGTGYTKKDTDGLDITTTQPGSWFAVVEKGGCSSIPSEQINVMVNTSGSGNIDLYTVEINGTDYASASFCSGGSHVFTINRGNPVAGVTYEWWSNGKKIGEGNGFVYTLPAGTTGTIDFSCKAVKGDLCPNTLQLDKSISVSDQPAPAITASTTDAMICNGSTLTLSVAAGASAYEWYKGDTKLTETTNSLTVTAYETAIYKVRTKDGSCYSDFASQLVQTAGKNNISWLASEVNPTSGEACIYTIATDGINPEPVLYEWSAGKASTVLTKINDKSYSVKFTESDALTVEATNTCGTTVLKLDITIANSCVDPKITAPLTNITYTVTGSTFQELTSNVTGTPAALKWQKQNGASWDDIASTNKSAYTPTAAGTYRIAAQKCSTTDWIYSAGTYTIKVINTGDYPASTSGSLEITGISCFDTRETFDVDAGDGNNGKETSRTVTTTQPKPVGTQPYTVQFTGSGKSIASVVWVVESNGFIATETTSGTTGETMTIGFIPWAELIAKTTDSKKATANQKITLTAYVTYSGGTPLKESVSKVLKVQDFICCDGALVENGAWDYANGSPGDWAVGKTSGITTNTQSNTGITLQTNMGGAYDHANYANVTKYFKTTSSGELCWYKKDGNSAKTTTWVNAVHNCANGTYADGKANAGWYLPNLKELDYLYRSALSGTLGGSKVGNATFFGGSSDAKALGSRNYWSSTEYSTTGSYRLPFYNGNRDYGTKTGLNYVRCVRRF